jgi:hypothetical protein
MRLTGSSQTEATAMRLTVKRVIFAGTAVAVSLWMGLEFLNFARAMSEWTLNYGSHTSILPTGQRVVIAGDVRAAEARGIIKPTGFTDYKSTMYEWPASTPKGDYIVAAGTPGVVKIDPAWDEDCCYPDRPIAVELRDGRWTGATFALPRSRLRIQRR